MAFPCGYNHSMASCASSTWQWPIGEKHLHMGHIMAPSGLSPADFRPSADACTKVFCERRKYSAKMAIFSSWSIQRDSFPCKSGEVPPRLAEKRKKLKLSCCIGFNNVPVWDHSQNLYITYGSYAGRAALYPWNAGQGTYLHCDHIHNDACLWPLSHGSRIFCKIYGPLDFSTFSNQAVSVNDPVS